MILLKVKVKRVIINMAPRHTKSEFASYLLPAWMVGKNPKLKIIQSTNTTELSVRFGRKAKQLMDSAEYKEVFQTRLKEDSQAAGKWETQQGGEYYAAGVGSAITGRGADLLIIDDPHTEQDAMNAQALDRTYEWYTSGPRQRLQPGGTIVIVMTRWNEKDMRAPPPSYNRPMGPQSAPPSSFGDAMRGPNTNTNDLLNQFMDRNPNNINDKILHEIDDILDNPSEDDDGDVGPQVRNVALGGRQGITLDL